ncbi:MAG: hypothetical protein PHF86_03145 [Candidatus Nanoarchaeia archaeon]|nr:hypothetical protein [Candidatus Nanoarchaeia archaeon]
MSIQKVIWRHIEKRIIEKDNLYYVGRTLCVDNKISGGIALNLNGIGFVYSKHKFMKNSRVYIPEHILKIIKLLYIETKNVKNS